MMSGALILAMIGVVTGNPFISLGSGSGSGSAGGSAQHQHEGELGARFSGNNFMEWCVYS